MICMNTKFGILVVEESPEKSFEFARKNCFKHLEIDLKQKHSLIECFSSSRIRKLKALSKKYSFTLSLHVPYTLNLSEETSFIRKASIDYLKKGILLAAKLNASHLTLHMGYFISISSLGYKRNEALNRLISSLKELLPLCKKYKVMLALENVNPLPKDSEVFYLGDNVEDFDVLFKKLRSKYLKMCLDVGHANINEGAMKYIKRYKENIIAVHVHDNNGKYDEHLPIGKGTIDWIILTKELKNINCPIIFELKKKYLLESKRKLEKILYISS